MVLWGHISALGYSKSITTSSMINAQMPEKPNAFEPKTDASPGNESCALNEKIKNKCFCMHKQLFSTCHSQWLPLAAALHLWSEACLSFFPRPTQTANTQTCSTCLRCHCCRGATDQLNGWIPNGTHPISISDTEITDWYWGWRTSTSSSFKLLGKTKRKQKWHVYSGMLTNWCLFPYNW